MVVSVDRFTAIKMYDKVQYYWEEKLKILYIERSNARSGIEKNKINKKNYMKSIEMAVVISGDGDDEEKFINWRNFSRIIKLELIFQKDIRL